MRVVITGADGFVGWHTRVRMHATTEWDVVDVTQEAWTDLASLLEGADAVVHLAGVNRGTDAEVEHGNFRLARELDEAIRHSGLAPVVVYANSTQSGNGSPYGRGKELASSILEQTVREVGGRFVDVVFPNLFGEHGRPHYNSFVATFAHQLVVDETPTVVDREVELLHAEAAAQVLIDAVAGEMSGRVFPGGTTTTVAGVLSTLRSQFELYRLGDIPPMASRLEVDLFNQLRAAMFPRMYPIPLMKRTDTRGSLVELVRAHGGGGQTFYSTTKPGITRGQHFHLRKVERFVVVAGQAEISLRRALTDEVAAFRVSGAEPVIVDMPTLWTHKITNTGTDELITMFWTNEVFDPEDTDTYAEDV